MKKLLMISFLSLVWTLGVAVIDANAQTAWGISIVRYNTSTRIVDGYSGTWLDYYAGLYYDPEVMGDLYRTDMNETDLDSGRMIGYADIVPAEVYLRTTNFVEGRTYCTYSTHFAWGVYYQPSTVRWFDPGWYSTFAGTGGSPWPGNPFSNYWTPPRRYRLGVTQACITIPIPPLPTPTPTPSPTPSPTPCNPAIEGSCPLNVVRISTTPSNLRPAGVSGGKNTARIAVCIEPAVAGRAANLQLVRRPQYVNSGGHVDSLHIGGQRPIGKLASENGTTGADGCFSTTYTPSHISGYVGVDGTISGRSTGLNILVRVDGLFDLGAGANYKLIGQTSSHPVNHWGTGPANIGLRQIADDYKNEFYNGIPIPEDQKVAYNDMSLEMGGKFDLGKRWENTNSQHGEHREGINCDTRSNNIPGNRWVRLNQIFFFRGSTGTHDETDTDAPHWHLRFLFGAQQATAERTPHMFTEDAFNAALERQSSQAEYETWLSRLTTAKAQGQSQLLSEARALESQIFDSEEYIARGRTDQEFINDVFWSHLFREPTEREASDWLEHLQGIFAITQQAQRMTFLYDFGSTTEFQSVVFGIVDPTLPTL